MRRNILPVLFATAVSAVAAVALTACQPSAPPPESPPEASSSPGAGDTAPAQPSGQAADEPAPAAASVYRARGNEPGWLASIDGNQFTLDARYGELQVSGPVPDIAPEADGSRSWEPAIEGYRVTLATSPGPCHDSMSGMVYPDRATLELDGESLSGCAGEPRDLLTGPAWRIEAIGSEATIPDSKVDIAFDDNSRVGGAGSCNRYTSGYTLDGEGLRLGPIAGTLMACEQALMDQEHRLHEALATVSRFDIADDGALLLLAGDDAVAVRAVR